MFSDWLDALIADYDRLVDTAEFDGWVWAEKANLLRMVRDKFREEPKPDENLLGVPI